MLGVIYTRSSRIVVPEYVRNKHSTSITYNELCPSVLLSVAKSQPLCNETYTKLPFVPVRPCTGYYCSIPRRQFKLKSTIYEYVYDTSTTPTVRVLYV
jgi:hypothetical protein